jgi:hypothetical protein
MYSVPSSVTFDAGQTEANIPVSYDPSKIEYGRYDNITIKIADNTQATEWGTSEYTFKAGVTDWGPWGKWNATGTASYVYVNYWTGEDPNLPFVYRHNMIKPNLYQFKISNWGYGVELVFDYDETTGHVTVAPQFTGYTHSSYGDIMVADLAAYDVIRGWDILESDYGTFDKEQGIITVPLVYYVSAGYFGADPESLYIDGYVRADYTTDLTFSGIFTDVAGANWAVANLVAGADVETAQAIVVPDDADADAVADAIAAGELEATDEVAPGTINVQIPEDMTGKLQIVVAVIIDGEVKSVASAPFEFYGGGANPWTSLGVGYWVDDIVVPLFTEAGQPYGYEVEIQENTETPGLYRVINAYAPVAAAFGMEGGNKNIEINAVDPTGVYILDQSIGLDFGYGEMSIETDAGYYVASYGFDAVKAQLPEIFGTVADGVISFPVLEQESSSGKMVNYQIWLNMGDSSYFGGRNGQFQVVLPGASEAVRAKARAKCKAYDFEMRLNGNGFGVKRTAKKMKKIVRNLQVKSDFKRR